MGWKREYGFPTVMTMEAIGVSSYNTYKKGLDDLVEWGFIKMIERSKNQFSSNIIALSFFDEAQYEADDKALDRAVSKHSTEHSRGTVQSIVSIDKQENIQPENKEPKNVGYPPDFDLAWELYKRKGSKKLALTEWKNLTDDEKKKVQDHIPSYIANTEPKYVKDFERYLKHGKYESDIINTPTPKKDWNGWDKPL
jgi:hypothetical protein